MNITLVGTGNMGSAFAKQLSLAGHNITVTGRDFAKAEKLAAQYDNVKAAPAAQAVGSNEVIIVATAYDNAVEAIKSLGNINDKIIIDITNPLTADYMGLTIGHTTSASEEIAKALPQVEVVKAFNTLFAQVLADGAQFADNQRATVFVASDSARAKQTAITLAETMGFKTQDAGTLKNARYLEPLAGLNIYFGYGAGLGTSVAPAWISK